MSKDDVFLDRATGDYYAYRKDLEVWAPIGNTGLHYRLAAEQQGGIGKFMQKVKTYKTKSLNPKEEIYISKLTEGKVIIKKEYLQHWALENMTAEFLCCHKNQWDPHPVNITNIDTVK